MYENNLEESDLDLLRNPNFENLSKFAISYSDAIIQASKDLNKTVISNIVSSGKPFLEFPGHEDYKKAYIDFYNNFIEEEVKA